MRKKFIIIWLIMIILCIGVGVFTRMSYKNYYEIKKDKMDLFVVGSGAGIMENINISDIEDKSEIVVRIKNTGEREYLYKTVLSKVEIIDVYKGKEKLNIDNKYIYVYEPSFFNFEKEYYMAVGAITIMRKNEQYILFLNRKDFPQKYKKSDKEKNEFVLATNNSLSKYLISEEYQKEIVSNDLKYGEIKEYEVMVSRKEDLDFYNKLKSSVLKEYVN